MIKSGWPELGNDSAKCKHRHVTSPVLKATIHWEKQNSTGKVIS